MLGFVCGWLIGEGSWDQHLWGSRRGKTGQRKKLKKYAEGLSLSYRGLWSWNKGPGPLYPNSDPLLSMAAPGRGHDLEEAAFVFQERDSPESDRPPTLSRAGRVGGQSA